MATPLHTPIPFRSDINGLRAWAVVAVLLFHFRLPGMDAGFMGVDIFFVLSGFLMMVIVLKGLEQNRFALIGFYLGRARRILPAAMVLIAALLVLGWFWLPTPDYQSLGAQSAYSLGFLSNIYFWRSSGYFDAAAHEKWLLHTWSLGVEAQFYLLFPLFVMLLWKIRPKLTAVVWGMGILFIASLALSIFASSWGPTAAFYLLPTRGWELAAGGLAYLAGREIQMLGRYSKALQTIGWGLLVVAMVTIDESLAWPSGWALLPVAGTVCILLARRDSSFLTGNAFAQWLGNRSYSLYLWHWPLMVTLYFVGLEKEWIWVAMAIVLSLLLADLSYRLVENPTRHKLTQTGPWKQMVIFLVAVAMIGVVAVSVRFVTFSDRLPPAVEIAAAEADNKDPRIESCFGYGNFQNDCVYGAQHIGAILLGDSHAGAAIGAFGVAAENHGQGVLLWAISGCRALKNAQYINKNTGVKCRNLLEWAENQIQTLESTIPLVLLSRTNIDIWGPNEEPKTLNTPRVYFSKVYSNSHNPTFQNEFKEALISTACDYAQNRLVYLVRPIPEIGIDVPKIVSRNMIFGRRSEDIKIPLTEYHERNKLVWEAQDEAARRCGVKILNPLPYLCDDDYCYGSRNGRPLYYDDDHLSEYGNRFLVPMFEEVFRK